MAIDLAQFMMILAANVKGRALSAGYPDLLVPKKELEKATADGDGVIHLRKNLQALQTHHSFDEPIYDSIQVFRAIGLELQVIDRVAVEGSEHIVDLNEHTSLPRLPFSDIMDGFDLVIDPGTSEHCFNIAQALQNLAGAVKVGGVMSQALPMSMFNHGYWNVNPVALLDFYEANGFAVEKMVIRHTSGIFEPKVEDRRKRMIGVPDGAVNIITARRLEKKPFTWPQQKP